MKQFSEYSFMDYVHHLRLLSIYYLAMATAVFRKVVSALSSMNWFPDLVTPSDRAVSAYFRYCGLSPCTVDLDDQTVMHFWVPKHRRFDKPSLVMVHGYGGNAPWQFCTMIGPLSRSFDVYVPDLVFFGKSFSKRSDRTDVFQARCIGEGLTRMGLKRFSVFGISYGGFVAYRIADLYQEEVEKVVLLSSAVCRTVDQVKEELQKLGRDPIEVLVPSQPDSLRFLFNRSMHRTWKGIPDFLLRNYINVIYKDYRKERMELVEYLLADADPLPVLNQETLIIWGDQDRVFPPYFASQLQSHLGAKSKVEIIKDVGHAANMESPDQLNNLIKSFVSAGSSKHNA
ncbi:hypothetical protein HHK36_014398 [Tetracentron sinense]|uniref:AB hydrolase-1 domain-containing protein n=1 Tax=Tetracentron sinense TaxID=13715 RepID=A0A834Z883_TETSI|nr:hypothetical protein HHK36_014398 [Tetracentron sinense]